MKEILVAVVVSVVALGSLVFATDPSEAVDPVPPVLVAQASGNTRHSSSTLVGTSAEAEMIVVPPSGRVEDVAEVITSRWEREGWAISVTEPSVTSSTRAVTVTAVMGVTEYSAYLQSCNESLPVCHRTDSGTEAIYVHVWRSR